MMINPKHSLRANSEWSVWFIKHEAPPRTALDDTIAYLKELINLAFLPTGHE